MELSRELLAAGEKVLDVWGELEVDSLGLIENNAPGTIAAFLENPKYLDRLAENIRVVITKEDCAEACRKKGFGVCVTENPKASFFQLHNFLAENRENYRLPVWKSQLGEDCCISEKADIASNNVRIGNRVVIEDYVVIHGNTVIEDDVVLRTGTVVGGEGFECKRKGDRAFSVRHCGGVKIGQGSEIQQNSCIDRGIYPYDVTEMGRYCMVDNLVHVAHHVYMGDRVFVAAGVLISGNVKIGDDVWIGPGSIISNRLEIGKRAKIDLGSVVLRDVREGAEVFGNPARREK